jgi:hypothetical protein
MIPQPVVSASTPPFRQSPLPRLHIYSETCPWCEQDIPPEKLEEINGKIAARERQQAHAITAKLEQQYAIDKARADAKAKADLELERQHSAARETAAREEARKAAEAAAAEKLVAIESARLQSEAVLQARITESEATKAAAQQKSVALQLQLHEMQKVKDAEVGKVKADAAAAAIRVRQEATEAAEALVRDRSAEKDKAVAEAEAKSAEAEGKLAKLSEQYELALNERLRSQREILEKAKDDAINGAKAKAFEETQKLSNKVTELQRALENKTAEELGEGAEVNLFEALKKEFPDDRIERVAKGAPGADVHHVVLHNGRECGTIVYDSKNHKAFRNEHVAKLVEDQIAARAEHAILSTHKFPQGARQLHMQDGVLLANPARVVTVVALIRQHLLQTHNLRLSSAERQHKTAALYAFITSERCTQLLGRVDAHTDELLDHQVKEKKWHETAWKKQGEAIRSIQKAKAELSTEISCIIGTAPEDALKLEETEQ